MMGKTLSKILLSVGLGIVLAACAAQPPVPQDHFYRLGVSADVSPLSARALDGVLSVERFAADGVTAGRPLVYSTHDAPNEVSEYHYHFWTEPPVVLLQDALVTYLRKLGIAQSVVTPEMRVPSDYVLSTHIRRIELVTGARPQGAVELEMMLRDNRGKLILLKDYASTVAATGAGVSAGVDAINRAVADIYARFTKDVSAL